MWHRLREQLQVCRLQHAEVPQFADLHHVPSEAGRAEVHDGTVRTSVNTAGQGETEGRHAEAAAACQLRLTAISAERSLSPLKEKMHPSMCEYRRSTGDGGFEASVADMARVRMEGQAVEQE